MWCIYNCYARHGLGVSRNSRVVECPYFTTDNTDAESNRVNSWEKENTFHKLNLKKKNNLTQMWKISTYPNVKDNLKPFSSAMDSCDVENSSYSNLFTPTSTNEKFRQQSYGKFFVILATGSAVFQVCVNRSIVILYYGSILSISSLWTCCIFRSVVGNVVWLVLDLWCIAVPSMGSN